MMLRGLASFIWRMIIWAIFLIRSCIKFFFIALTYIYIACFYIACLAPVLDFINGEFSNATITDSLFITLGPPALCWVIAKYMLSLMDREDLMPWLNPMWALRVVTTPALKFFCRPVCRLLRKLGALKLFSAFRRQKLETAAAVSYFDFTICRPVCLLRNLGYPRDAHACILATSRLISHADTFVNDRDVCARLMFGQPPPNYLTSRPPPALLQHYGTNVPLAATLLHVRCAQNSFVACCFTSSAALPCHVDARTRLHWTHFILARVQLGHRQRIMKTLAALEDPQVVFYNGFAYTTLASRNPYSNTFTGEQHELYSLDPAWQLCPNTCDARTVCATYPWSAYALVFADASAHWTNQASEPGVV